MMRGVSDAIMLGTPSKNKHERFSFQPLGEDATRVTLKPTYRGLIEDKEEANQLREEVLLPAIAKGEAVEINLEQGTIIAHSCAHALLYEVIRQAGPDARQLVHVRAKTRQVKEVVRAIARTVE